MTEPTNELMVSWAHDEVASTPTCHKQQQPGPPRFFQRRRGQPTAQQAHGSGAPPDRQHSLQSSSSSADASQFLAVGADGVGHDSKPDETHDETGVPTRQPRVARAGESHGSDEELDDASSHHERRSQGTRKGQLKVVELPQHLCPRPRPKDDDDAPELSAPRFGSLRFPSSRSTTKPTKWVCIGPSTEQKHVDAITELIFHTWNLAPPPVVLSVIGATRQLGDHSTPANVRHAFLRGLRSAAAKTHAWVFTAGTNSGASAIAGEALRQEAEDTGESHVVMGFAPWRRVHLHDKIEQHKKAMVLDCQSALA